MLEESIKNIYIIIYFINKYDQDSKTFYSYQIICFLENDFFFKTCFNYSLKLNLLLLLL